MVKTNDVVAAKDESYFMPGRVWLILPDGRAVVICCGLHIRIYNPADLEVSDYKGRWMEYGPGRWVGDDYVRKKKWLPMTSLRRLKQHASRYHPDIWKWARPKGTLPKHATDYKPRPRQ